MSNIITVRSGSILSVELNRPTKKNAMTAGMYTSLADTFSEAAEDEAIRVVLWFAAGEAFCAGNDVGDFLKNPPGPGESPQARLSGCAPRKPRKRCRRSSRSVRPISPTRSSQRRPHRSVPSQIRSTPMSTHENRARATTQTGALWRIASARLPTKWGMFEIVGFERDVWAGGRTAETALAVVLGDLRQGAPLLRIHSQCLTGEVLGSLR